MPREHVASCFYSQAPLRIFLCIEVVYGLFWFLNRAVFFSVAVDRHHMMLIITKHCRSSRAVKFGKNTQQI